MNPDDLAKEFLTTPSDSLEVTEQKPKSEADSLALEFLKPSTKTPKQLSPAVTFNEQGAPVVSRESYSQDDLVSDEFYTPIAEYMKYRFGSQAVEGDRKEVVNKFLNNMRGFAGGNSVRAVNEISFLNSVEGPQEKAAAAKAYAIYDKMEGIFGDTTLGEHGS